MTQIRTSGHASTASVYADMPFTQLLIRYIWPFWLFKDASRGDRTTRSAAYRHNRSMRIYLPGYLLKWMFGSAFAFSITAGFDSLAAHSSQTNVFTLMAAGGGIVFAGSVCMLLITSYIYLYLGRYDC